MEICEASPQDMGDVARLYREAGYGAPIRHDDTVIVAKVDGRVVGAVRLCTEERVTVLRGMQIQAGFQRQRIGSRLLHACQPYLEQGDAFCLPYTHLVSFYSAAHFRVVSAEDLPEFLSQRLASYLAQGQKVLAMRRLARTGVGA
jgi:N-acetylglutamate synthase-like GNAT family acetyltransferase